MEDDMGYADRDKYGIYRGSTSAGPGPALMGADTLIGDGVVNAAEEDLGDIASYPGRDAFYNLK